MKKPNHHPRRKPPLVVHADHQVVILPSGSPKHAAKYHCVTCNKFVAWLSHRDAQTARELGLFYDPVVVQT